MTCKNIALVPSFEPQPVLLEVLDQLKTSGMEIVLIDDGSGPRYSGIFDRASSTAKVLSHAGNKGKGAALKTGMSYINAAYGTESVIVTVDGDGQHRAEDALLLCQMARQHPNALILGSRNLQDNVPAKSKIGNTITRYVYRATTHTTVYDTQTGLRAFSARLLPDLLIVPGNRYEYEMNVLLEFARRKIPIIETEIETIYIDNNAASHFDALWDSIRIYKEILKFSASSFLGFLVDYLLYSLLLLLTGNLLFSNVGARIVSAAVNYTVNRKFVFQSQGRLVKSVSQYALLAMAVLLGNTLCLELLVNTIGIHQMLAKLLTEILFFLINWSVQRFLIFKKKGE